MDIHPDFRELLACFNASGVEYIIIGGHALAFHGAPRTTGDIDLYVHPTPQNASAVIAALSDFGFGGLGLTERDFELPGQVIQLGVPPVRVDIVTSIDGVDWPPAWENRVEGAYGDVPVHYIGRREFLANKRATGRKQDLADLEALGDP